MATTLYISNGVQAELNKYGWCDGLTLRIRPRDCGSETPWIEDSGSWICERSKVIRAEDRLFDRVLARQTKFIQAEGCREQRTYTVCECRAERTGDEWVEALEGARTREKGVVRVWDVPLSVFVTYTPQ